MEWWQVIKDEAIHLGKRYNVNPLIFAVIYIGAIPFFLASLSWLVRNIKQKKSIVIPLLLAGFFFISSYLYVLLVGKNIPVWVYGVIGLLVGYGIYSVVKKIKKKLS